MTFFHIRYEISNKSKGERKKKIDMRILNEMKHGNRLRTNKLKLLHAESKTSSSKNRFAPSSTADLYHRASLNE